MARHDKAMRDSAVFMPDKTTQGDAFTPCRCTSPRKHFTADLKTIGLLVFLAWMPFSTLSASASTVLVALRSDQSLLPESILRETYATIDRSRRMLVQRRNENGLWTLADGSVTVFPALALCDAVPGFYAEDVSESIASSTAMIEGILSKPWTAQDAAEVSYTALAGMLNGHPERNARLLERLARTPLTAMRLDAAALTLMTLDGYGRPTETGWSGLLNSLHMKDRQTLESVAISAAGRLKTGRYESGRPSNDVLAHVRWIARRINLGYGKTTPVPDPLSPKAAFYVSALASQLPRQSLVGDPSMLPYDWRNHMASRLIAQQITDSATGLNYWDSSHDPSPSSDAALRDTTYAIMTLIMLSE